MMLCIFFIYYDDWNAMTTVGVPTLSAKGIVFSVPEKTDALIAYFFASDAGQSYLFEGNITNLQDLIQQCMHDIPTLKQRLRVSLEQYLNRHFEMALVDVGDDIATNPSNKINLFIQITVTQDGKDYSVANELSLVDGKFNKITKLNNTGTID